MDVFDVNRQTYRRLYVGFLRGKRINSVSIEAEATFWRLMMLADDCGNLYAGKGLRDNAYPRRDVSEASFMKWMNELVEAHLVTRYSHESGDCIHLNEFSDRQPASTRNGKLRRHAPEFPGDDAGNLGKIGCKPVQTGEAEHTSTSTSTSTKTTTTTNAGESKTPPKAVGRSVGRSEVVALAQERGIGVAHEFETVPVETFREVCEAADKNDLNNGWIVSQIRRTQNGEPIIWPDGFKSQSTLRREVEEAVREHNEREARRRRNSNGRNH